MQTIEDITAVQPSMETIMMLQLDKTLMDVEENFHFYLIKKDYVACGEILHDFCCTLLDLEDMEQVFVARVYFRGIITHFIQTLARKSQLHPRTLTGSYREIERIDNFATLTEFFLYIPQFIRLIRQATTNHPETTNSKYVDKALHIIQDHLEEGRLSVQWIAEKLEISRTHLSNLFKIEMGESTAKYITRRKIEEVIYELNHTSKSLKDIRKKYGFTNHSHFIQQFKKLQGMTPLQYIQKHFS
jgi:YesN/AraC family two-component response regulator